MLTAHPTEVQRQSVLDAHTRPSASFSPNWPIRRWGAKTEIEAKLKRVILALWQTSEIRLFKLTVKDEIENGVAYHPTTFFTALPKLYASLEDAISREWGQRLTLPNFFRIGSWIGGDRDGNPFVTADVTCTPPSVRRKWRLPGMAASWTSCTANCRCRRAG